MSQRVPLVGGSFIVSTQCKAGSRACYCWVNIAGSPLPAEAPGTFPAICPASHPQPLRSLLGAAQCLPRPLFTMPAEAHIHPVALGIAQLCLLFSG